MLWTIIAAAALVHLPGAASRPDWRIWEAFLGLAERWSPHDKAGDFSGAADPGILQRIAEPADIHHMSSPDGCRSIRVVGGEPSARSCTLGKHQEWKPRHVEASNYIFSSDQLPEDRRYYATVGNGHLGTAVYSDKVYLNGVYNGRGSRSHRAAIPAWGRLNITSVTPSVKSPTMTVQDLYSLNTVEGVFSHSITASTFMVLHKLYAHRTLSHLLVNDISIMRISENETTIEVMLDAGTKFVSDDIVFKKEKISASITLMKGKTRTAETRSSFVMPVHCYFDDIPTSLILPAGISESSWTFLTSVGTNEDSVVQQYKMGMQLLRQGPDDLYRAHIEAWAETWQRGRIDIWGTDTVSITAARTVYSSLYYILSSLPLPEQTGAAAGQLPFFGLSPESLAYGDGTLDDYQGHVFWDQETWMFPPVLALQSNFTRQIMSSRTRVLTQALENARASNDLGARFPWEQAFTGVPSSPSAICEKYEIHINGDIALAIRQYVSATMDTDYITFGYGLQLAEELAEFWRGRLVLNVTDALYHIYDVQPPDEHHYPVNDSVYTNSVAKLALQLPAFLRKILNDLSNGSDQLPAATPADMIYIPFDSVLRYHPEFEGYRPNKSDSLQPDPTVKQADAIMLGYPLMEKMPADVHLNDLNIYAAVTDSVGPAMTWGIFAIGYLQQRSIDAATKAFTRQFVHITAPFQVWTENSDGSGAVNFVTGMGGFLQSILAGYVGIRYHNDRLEMNPQLVAGSTAMLITGLDYRGASIDVNVTAAEVTLTLTHVWNSDVRLFVQTEHPPADCPLRLLEAVVIAPQKAYVVPY